MAFKTRCFRPEVRKIVGEQLVDDVDKYHHVYTAATAIVTLEFSHYTDAGDVGSAYKVGGIMIEKK